MKRHLVLALGLINFVLTCVGFVLYLNWYDVGDLDFSGWHGMTVAGAVCGIWVVLACTKPFRTFNGEMENVFLFYIRQVTFHGLGLIGSFALGYVVELFSYVKDSAEVLAILPTILIIPLVTMFYSLIMIPFAVYLGITNGSLFRLMGQKQQQGPD